MAASVAVEPIIEDEIPVIDLSLLRTGTPQQRSQIIRDIGRACEEWACFSVINHGVPESLRTSMVEAYTEFFDLSVGERKEYFGKAVLDPIRHETGIKTTDDGEQYWRDFVRVFIHPTLHTPSKPLNFRAICEEYGRQTREIAHSLLIAIGESLGLEEGYMEKALDLANGNQILVGNQYPPSSLHKIALGLSAHSDPSMLSVLMQNGSIDGLQVMHNGQWVPVRVIPGSFFIQAGDLLEIVSNGIYKSLLHRAVLNNKSSRMSVVSSIGPPLEHIIEPAPKLVEIANNLVFRSIKYMDFVELVRDNQFNKSVFDLIRT